MAASATCVSVVVGNQNEASLVSSLNSVPGPSAPFIGRARELAEIAELLRQPSIRLVTLTGSGGIGKTRIAQEAARLAQPDDFPDGVAFTSLASVRDPDLLPEVIAQELDVPLGAGHSRERDLFDFVRDRRMLLVLDNFEQVLGGRYLISQLLEAAPPGFVILVTSQHILELSWERSYPVLEMAPPPPGEAQTAERLKLNDAAQLFEVYARAANPRFAVTDANAEHVAEICRQLEGLPLALELAAARIRSTDPGRLLALLTPRLGFLRRDDGDHPERQHTMAHAINWSFGLLSERQQRLLRRLSVFAAGFGAERAVRVGSGSHSDGFDTLPGLPGQTAEQQLHEDLDELVKASLLRFEFSDDGQGRYRMLGAVREFGAAKLVDSGEHIETQWTFVGSMLAFVEEIKPSLRGDQAATAIAHLEAEHPNIQSALEWSISQGKAGSESALRICTAVWGFWKQRGYLREAERWLRLAIESAGDEETFYLGNGYLLLGHTVNDQRTGWTCYERALEIYRRLGPSRYVAGTLNSLGQTAIYQGEYGRAKSLLQEALKFFNRDDVQSTTSDLAHVHYQLGILHARLGEHDGAIVHLDAARELWEGSAQTVDVINAIIELGHVYTEQAKYESARNLLNWALIRARRSSDFDAEVRALAELGFLEAQAGNVSNALDHLRTALKIYHDNGYVFGTVVPVLETLASMAIGERQCVLAASLLGFAENWRRKSGMALHPTERAGRNRTIEQAKRLLGATAFEAAWSRGQRLLQLSEIVDEVDRLVVTTDGAAPRATRVVVKSKLTPREHEVLCQLVTGLKYHEIADVLGIKETTVKTLVDRVYRNLDVNNRTAATAYAFQHGLCVPPAS